MSSEIILIYCPFPTRAAARDACCALLEKRLIACGNILPMGESHYWWEGSVTQAEECILIAKTTASHGELATQKLASLHPYSSPAILHFKATANPQFAAWAAAATQDSILPTASD